MLGRGCPGVAAPPLMAGAVGVWLLGFSQQGKLPRVVCQCCFGAGPALTHNRCLGLQVLAWECIVCVWLGQSSGK